MSGKAIVVLGVGCLLAASLSADVRALDPAAPLRDLADNPAGAAFGFDGDLGESVFTDADWYYREDAEATVRAFRSVGARLVRQQRALSRFQGERATRLIRWEKDARAKRADAARILDPKVKVSWTDPKNVFELYRKAGLKAILCLDRYAYDVRKDELTEDPEVSAKAVGDFLRWIVANGYRDLVVGFEMENESYYRDNPEQYGARWRRILPEMRRIWPDVKVGCSLPIYVDADPDLIAVRDRARAEMNLRDVISRHTPEYVNKSFYRQMTALGDEITNVTHAIIHLYGATQNFTCSYTGILRARAMLKAFPMLAGRHFWITEWRERSVEDLTCQRAFRSSLWKATFLLMALVQPDVDASCLHNTITHAGVFHQSDGAVWQRCYERAWGFKRGKTNGPRPPEIRDTTGVGRRHLAVGAAGAMFSVVNPALDSRPLVLGYGSDHGFLASAKYYGQYHTLLPKKGVPVAGDTVWAAVAEKGLGSVALVAVNTRPKASSVEISVKGFRPGAKGRLRLVRCPDPARIDELENPNEAPPWTIEEREVAIAGPTIRLDVPRDAVAALVVPEDAARTPAKR